VAIPFEIPGFNQIIPSIPEGHLIIIKGTENTAKNFFTQLIVASAANTGYHVNFITTKGKKYVEKCMARIQPEVLSKMSITEEKLWTNWLDLFSGKSIVVIDSYSYFFAERDGEECRIAFDSLRLKCAAQNSTAICVIDAGIIDDKIEKALDHLADGKIEFLGLESTDAIKRYMRIEKWVDGRSFDENIFYSIQENRMSIDLRYRVV
jgi:KaiC/GvpD/RAD55 family RecA-like ATPase